MTVDRAVVRTGAVETGLVSVFRLLPVDPLKIRDRGRAHNPYSASGNRNDATIEAKGEKTGPVDYASIYSRLNQRDEAFESLNKALDMGDPYLFGLKVSAEWDNLRDDPRFQDILRRAKYPI